MILFLLCMNVDVLVFAGNRIFCLNFERDDLNVTVPIDHEAERRYGSG